MKISNLKRDIYSFVNFEKAKAFVKKNPTTTALIAGPALSLLVYSLQVLVTKSPKSSKEQSFKADSTQSVSEAQKQPNVMNPESSDPKLEDAYLANIQKACKNLNQGPSPFTPFIFSTFVKKEQNNAGDQWNNDDQNDPNTRLTQPTLTPQRYQNDDDKSVISTDDQSDSGEEESQDDILNNLLPLRDHNTQNTKKRKVKVQQTPKTKKRKKDQSSNEETSPHTIDKFFNGTFSSPQDNGLFFLSPTANSCFSLLQQTLDASSQGTSSLVISPNQVSLLEQTSLDRLEIHNSNAAIPDTSQKREDFDQKLLVDKQPQFCIGTSSPKLKQKRSRIPLRRKVNENIVKVLNTEKSFSNTLVHSFQALFQRENIDLDNQKYKQLIDSLLSIRETEARAIQSIIEWSGDWEHFFKDKKYHINEENRSYIEDLKTFYKALFGLASFLNPHAFRKTYNDQYTDLLNLFDTLNKNSVFYSLLESMKRENNPHNSLENSFMLVSTEECSPTTVVGNDIHFKFFPLTTTKDKVRDLVSLLDEITRVFFLKIDISNQADNLVKIYISNGYKYYLDGNKSQILASCFKPHHSIKAILQADFRVLDALFPISGACNWIQKEINKAKGHLDIYWSSFHISNFAHKVISFSSCRRGKEVDVIRMGCPTVSTDVCTVLPIFESFIRLYEKEGKKHLYFNLQNDKNKSCLLGMARLKGDERTRIEAVKSCAGQYPQALLHCIFPMDSSLWKLKLFNSSSNITFNLLKETLRDNFINREKKEGAFHFPDVLSQNEAALEILFNDVMEPLEQELFPTFFKERCLLLGREESRACLFIFYVSMARQLARFFEADSCNFTCKDGIDRGGSFNAIFICLELLRKDAEAIKKEFYSGRDNTLCKIKSQMRLLVNQFSFLVKKQPVVKSRREHLIDTLDFIFNNFIKVIAYLTALDSRNSEPSSEKANTLYEILFFP